MYKKIIGIFVSTLLIVTTFPTVCSLNNKKLIDRVDSDNSHSSTQANWFEVQKLLASDGADSNYFGYSVSISGDYAIIGSHCDDSARGSAYVFKRSGSSWSQEAKLVASDGSYDDYLKKRSHNFRKDLKKKMKKVMATETFLYISLHKIYFLFFK